jgi:hypothetical protein
MTHLFLHEIPCFGCQRGRFADTDNSSVIQSTTAPLTSIAQARGVFDWDKESRLTLVVLASILGALALILLAVCCSRRARIARAEAAPDEVPKVEIPLISDQTPPPSNDVPENLVVQA